MLSVVVVVVIAIVVVVIAIVVAVVNSLPLPNGSRSIAAREVYNDVFKSMNEARGSFCKGGKFELLENDYVLSLTGESGFLKFGGNAQAITSLGFLHHTSFLYDWDDVNMSHLTVPKKRPDYRGDRGHGGFLVKMREVWGKGCDELFYDTLERRVRDAFDVEEKIEYDDVMEIVFEGTGGQERWEEWCRGKPGSWGRLGARTRWVEDERRELK